MINPMNLSGKTILITGASSGIGRETAILASNLGAKVILVARREDALKDTSSCLGGTGHTYYCHDLSEVDTIEALYKRITSDSGIIEGFVHSAGIRSTRPLRVMRPKHLHSILAVNFYSFVEMARCFSKPVPNRKTASIVGISSVASVQGSQGKTAYCASKAAMDAAVRCMAKELAKGNIRINTVQPGLIKTEMYSQFLTHGERSDDAKSTLERQYMGIGEPIDVANMIAYLLSDAARFITGASVPLDGGLLSS